jgi:CHASE3 domain sensor protein
MRSKAAELAAFLGRSPNLRTWGASSKKRGSSMKKVVLVLLILGLSVFVISSLVEWRTEKAERRAQAWRAVDDSSAQANRQLDAQLLEIKN